jgi:hypothetical protein
MPTVRRPAIQGERVGTLFGDGGGSCSFVDNVGDHCVLPSMPLPSTCYCCCPGAHARRSSPAQAVFLVHLCVFELGVVL